MTAFWTYDNLARVTGGTWLAPPADGGAVLPAAQRAAGPVIWHDTRDLEPGQCYLAVKGDNFDGHDFVEQAFENGAALALVNAGCVPKSATRNPNSPILAVPDTVTALQALARVYRDELAQGTCKVIGVAGSNGKTTTRHLIHHVLTHAGKTGTQSPKSFNNHLGVPLTLLAARPTDDFVACEIGTNHPGEIDFLSAICRPDIAVITSIGEEHLEFFGDLDGVAEEEFAILNHLSGDDVVVVGDLGPFYQRLRYRMKPTTTEINTLDGGYTPPSRMCLQGEHNQMNATVAAYVAEFWGVDESQCDAALLAIRPEAHRGELIRLGEDVLIYDDCYNANPASMRAAIDALDSLPERRGRKVAILGDMFELGEASDTFHGEIARYAGKYCWPILIGDKFSRVETDMFARPPQLAWSDRLPGEVADLLQPGDTVLLKGSRGMRLERLIPAIEKRFGKVESPHPVSET